MLIQEEETLVSSPVGSELVTLKPVVVAGVLDGYHVTPLGDSDMPQRSRVSYLSTEMTEAKQIGVRALSCYGFRLIDGTFL